VLSADPVPILQRLGGRSRRAVLLDEGVNARGLARAAAAGHVRRCGGGVYALPGADPAIVVAIRCGGLLTCASGAGALGLAVLTPARRVHVATRNNPVGLTWPPVLHRGRARRYDGPLPVASERVEVHGGLRLVRFTYEDVVHRPSWVVPCVLEALRADATSRPKLPAPSCPAR
jgi:hypothetical protein